MKLAVVGTFFDGYEDLWYDFIGLMKKNWSDCPYDFYIVDNVKELDKEKLNGMDVKVVHAGEDAEYSKRIQAALREIDADYFLLLLEDFFIVEKVDNERIKNITDFIEREKIEYYTMPMPEFMSGKEKERYGDEANVFRIGVNKEYTISCQPSIWERKFLSLCVGEENYNAWIFEGIYARTQCVRNKEFLAKSVVDYGNPLNLRHGALQGKMLSPTVKAIEKCGYKLTSRRELLSKNNELKHRLKEIAHTVIRKLHLTKIVKKLKKDSVLDKFSEQIAKYSEKTISDEKIAEFVSGRGERVCR